jgi:molecular chaperone GrpE
MSEPSREPKKDFQVSDRRFWVEDESSIEGAQISEPKFPSFVEELKARTEAAEGKLREKVNELERENAAFRSRLERELERRKEQTKADLILEFLEVVDNFERALGAVDSSPASNALQEGVRLNLELFLSKLKNLGVEPIANLHEPFDPSDSEAIGVLPVEDPKLDQRVVAILQKGYRIGDQILRPAIVQVGEYRENRSD